jgi:hypothetical protein
MLFNILNIEFHLGGVRDQLAFLNEEGTSQLSDDVEDYDCK